MGAKEGIYTVGKKLVNVEVGLWIGEFRKLGKHGMAWHHGMDSVTTVVPHGNWE